MNRQYSIPDLEKIAEIVIKEFGCGDDVDVIQLANQLGFEVYQTDFADNIAGKVERNSTNSRIFVNRSDIPARKRFTVAHEIGHIILHNDISKDIDFVDYRNNGKYDQREFEADNFAAALLMPREKSKKVWNEYHDIDDFAVVMGVSKRAAAIRLTNLGLIS